MTEPIQNSQPTKRSRLKNQTNAEAYIPPLTSQTMARSRLKRSAEKRTKQQITYMVLAMLGIVAILALFGVPLLVNYSVLVDKIRGEDTTVVSETKEDFIAAPLLLAEFTATNSAEISLSGTAPADHTIKLYVNNNLLDKVTVKKDGTFTARNIQLEDGDNDIKAKAVNKNNKESSFSETVTIFFKNQPPELSIDYPQDNQIVTGENNTVQITGKTDAGAKVRINGFWAIVDENGNYKYNFTIQSGDNRFTVESTDKAGNKTEQSRNVIYNR